jgi:hypothetical protein
MNGLMDRLLASDEPSIRWKVRSRVLGESDDALADLRREIKDSPRVRTLLGDGDESGRVQMAIIRTRRGKCKCPVPIFFAASF